MMPITLEDFIRLSKSNYVLNCADYLIVEVKGVGGAVEMIINPKENFEAKMDYYSKAYNDDLTLKNNPAIEIVYYNFVTAEDLRAYFL